MERVTAGARVQVQGDGHGEHPIPSAFVHVGREDSNGEAARVEPRENCQVQGWEGRAADDDAEGVREVEGVALESIAEQPAQIRADGEPSASPCPHWCPLSSRLRGAAGQPAPGTRALRGWLRAVRAAP